MVTSRVFFLKNSLHKYSGLISFGKLILGSLDPLPEFNDFGIFVVFRVRRYLVFLGSVKEDEMDKS